MTLDVTLQDITSQLESLKAEKAILYLLYRYGHCIDYGLEREWVSLFTRDGIFDVRYLHGLALKSQKVQGHDALAKFIAGHSRAPAKYHKHFLVEPVILLQNENEAKADSYFASLDEENGKPYVRAFGRYLDKLVKQEGQWRFLERIAEIEALQVSQP